jgi:hypothetical protein
MRKSFAILIGCLGLCVGIARADMALLLEEPYGTFGGMNPTGHAAIYLSRVCAETPLSLRRCNPGETGVVISRYHRVGGYDWVAVPLIPYLYAVDTPDQVPEAATVQEVAQLRDAYRRAHLESIAPDGAEGATPAGEWIQLVGEAYDRTMYSFGIETTEEQDDALIRTLNEDPNKSHFHIAYRNCADFSRKVINFYYPGAIHRSFGADVGIMTPKQAANCLVRYSKKHPGLAFTSFEIAQVPGTVPRSSSVKGVLESVLKSKRYMLPIAPLAVLHPAVGGGLAYAWIERSRFNPKKIVDPDGKELPLTPGDVALQLQSNGRLPGVFLGIRGD